MGWALVAAALVIQEAMRDELSVLTSYSAARMEPLANHQLAVFIGNDLADAVRVYRDDSYKVRGAQDAETGLRPLGWPSFDPMVTETAQRGFYVVYLFRGDGDSVYLSLNQGTTEVLDLVGGTRYIEELQIGPAPVSGFLQKEDTSGLETGPIDLSGVGPLTRGYEAGNHRGRPL